MDSLWVGRLDSLEDCFALGQEWGGGGGEIAHFKERVCRSQPFILLGAFAQFARVHINFAMSVCPHVCTSAAPTRQIFVKFDIGWRVGAFNKNLYRNSKFCSNRTKISVTLHVDLSTFYFFFPVTINLWQKLFSCATFSIFILSTVTWRLAIDNVHIVAFMF